MIKEIILSSVALAGLLPNANAVTYGANITHDVIYGSSGNGNGAWAVDQAGNVEVGLRTHVRFQNTFNHIGNGVYTHAKSANPGDVATWNYDWSVNSDIGDGLNGPYLSGLDIYLAVDIDSSQGVNFAVFNPYDAWIDNQFGNINTANSSGAKRSDELAAAGEFNLVQNSQNIGWAPFSLDTSVDGTYDFSLWVKPTGSGDSVAPLAQVSIQVIVGQGGAPVPEAGASLALLGLGALALGGLNMRRKAA